MEVMVDGASLAPRAAPVVFAEIFRLVMVQKFVGTITCMNTFYFGTEGTGSSANTLVSDWATNIVPTWKANIINFMTFEQVYAQKVMPTQEAIASVTLSGSGSGSGGFGLPSVACGILTWRTQLSGRRRRGRTYIAGMGYDSSLSANGITWTATGISKLTNIGTAILNRYTQGANPGGFVLIVWSRTQQASVPAAEWQTAASQVMRYTAQSYIGSMGTRRGSRGI